MNYDYEIQNLKNQISDLQDTVRKLAKGNTEEVSKREQTTAQVNAITPYTETKTAYIGDTKVIFKDIPEGNLSVYLKDSKGNYPEYTVERMSDRITVSFDPLKYVTTITISIS